MGLLDNDLYQFTMSQWVWRHEPNRIVRYRFRNRTFAVPLGDALDVGELRRRLGSVSATRATAADVEVLRGLGLFDEAWLAWLAGVDRLPDVHVEVRDGHLELGYEGPWPVAIFLETPVLATVTELYHERFVAGTAEGERRLEAKLRHLRANPQLRFVEFGSRRRFSRTWQAHVVERLVSEVPGSLLGTSNVELAARHGLPTMGTMAHQLFMVAAALDLAAGDDDLGESACRVLGRWEAMFPSLQVLLPDTYTTSYLLPRIDRFAHWHGVRQDSGDPIAIGEQALAWWRRNGEDPARHGLVFSDALDLRDMSVLHDAFARSTDVTFGWGTNLTNDLGFEALSLVIKPDSVDGHPCVKLSDNLAKATGPRPEIQRYARLVGAALP